MRIDHFAYQRASRVAWLGFLVQALMGVGLLLFGLLTGDRGDTALLFGALYILCGPLVWLSLVVLFHQHRLERLESLEEDELAAAREGTSSIFDAAEGEGRVAARRLRLMHQWLMPAVSVLLAVSLGLLAWWMLARLAAFNATGAEAVEAGEFAMSPQRGWAVAVCLALAAVSFIFSRFVAGMAQQPAWQNLRGGAGSMVGSALVLFAIAAGVVFRFFDNNHVIEGIAYAIPIFMIVLSVEAILNLVLNFYRPRIPGQAPRPAFDSGLLSFAAAPDTFVRTINEAVNYQFGFDVTSTWGYQLLMRSLVKLFVIGVVVLVILSTLVVVEPHQQAVRLSGGRIADDTVHGSGLLLKLPWPFQTAEVHDVARVRTLNLTARRTKDEASHGNFWNRRLKGHTDREMEPFLVRRSPMGARDVDAAPGPGTVPDPGAADPSGDAEPDERVSGDYSLLDTEIGLQYRIRDSQGGLIDFLTFAPDTIARRESMSMRDKALRAIALREVSLHLSTRPLEQVLAADRGPLAGDLRRLVQDAFDRHQSGVEVLAVSVPLLRPAGEAATNHEDFMMAREDARTEVARAQSIQIRTLTYLVGDPERARLVLDEIQKYLQLEKTLGRDAAEVLAQREAVERLLRAAGGHAGQQLRAAQTERMIKIMSERSQAAHVAGQLDVYRAAPDLYRQREIMRAFAALDTSAKYLIGIDPERVNLTVEFPEINPYLTQFNRPLSESGKGEENKK